MDGIDNVVEGMTGLEDGDYTQISGVIRGIVDAGNIRRTKFGMLLLGVRHIPSMIIKVIYPTGDIQIAEDVKRSLYEAAQQDLYGPVEYASESSLENKAETTQKLYDLNGETLREVELKKGVQPYQRVLFDSTGKILSTVTPKYIPSDFLLHTGRRVELRGRVGWSKQPVVTVSYISTDDVTISFTEGRTVLIYKK